MNPALKKLLITRYKIPLILIIVIISSIYAFQTLSGITSWKSSFQYFSTEKAEIDFKRQIKNSYDFEDEQTGKIFLYYDLEKEHAIYTDNFKDYKDYSLVVFNPVTDANQLPYNAYSYYNEHFIFLLILFIISGVLLFLYDLKTQFTAALFSSKFKRQEIYWHKLVIVGSTLSGTLFVAKIIALITYRLFIPSEFLNITLKQHLFSTLSGWLTLVAVFIISSFIGMLFGEWLFGLTAITVLYFTFSMFLASFDSIYRTIFIEEGTDVLTVSTNVLERALPIVQTSIDQINLPPLLGTVCLSVVLLILGGKVFQVISLERIGEAILVPQFNRVFQAFIIFYGMVITSGSLFLFTFFPASPPGRFDMIFNLIKISAWFVTLFLLSEFILFNKKSKILKKLSFFNT